MTDKFIAYPAIFHPTHNARDLYLVKFPDKLEMKWSPEQISGWLRRTKPRQKTLRISPETIYKTLYFRSREARSPYNIADSSAKVQPMSVPVLSDASAATGLLRQTYPGDTQEGYIHSSFPVYIPCEAVSGFKLWIGSCQAVCDQLGSEGLKLSKAAINQTANRTIRISNASRRRRPLLNFVNVTSLSSVYSWLKKGSPGYRLFLPDAKTDNSTRLPQYCCCMD